MGAHDHKEKAAALASARAAIITVSDSRTTETDESGGAAGDLLRADGHEVVYYAVVPNEEERIVGELARALAAGADFILFSGGTGLSSRDRTLDVVTARFTKTLPGFGELFRQLSFKEIGSAAMMSRAAAGAVDGRFVACLPGSRAAVVLALRELILPELRHLLWELRR